MTYRKLGRSGLQLSGLSLGSWITFANQITDDTAASLMELAYDKGVNFFDSAEVYEDGKAEVVIGKILKRMGWGRDTFVVSSKVFWGGDRANQVGLSRKHVLEACHAALKRLQVDYLDLYFCHRPDPNTPLEETVWVMNDLVRQGKILYWGTSQWSPELVREAHKIARSNYLTPPVVEQPQYNMVFRKNVEENLLSLYAEIGLGLTTWSPLCSGVLTGKYSKGIPQDTRMNYKELGGLRERLNGDEGKVMTRKLQKLSVIAGDLHMTMPQLAIGWCLQNPNVSSVILGASNREQLTENLTSINVIDSITPDCLKEIDGILNEPPAIRF
jgi:voltage-dependent potassium channel beta subunit